MSFFAFVILAALPLASCTPVQHDRGQHLRGLTHVISEMFQAAGAGAHVQASELPSVISLSVETIRELDHEGLPFTQGLEISADGKYLIETSGSYPPGTDSYVRVVDPATGKTVEKQAGGLDSKFAEGIVQLPTGNGNFYMSTYQDRALLEYKPGLEFVQQHSFPYTGWGLSRSADSSSFLATDGSPFIRELQIQAPFSEISSKPVMCRGSKVNGLNELEMVDNFLGHGPRLLGNVYLSRVVLAIDPTTGECTHVANLEGIGEPYSSDETGGFHACNGLAYNRSSQTFFATGKNWKKMFEVRLVEDASDKDQAVLKLDKFLRVFTGTAMMQLQQIPRPVLHGVGSNLTTNHISKASLPFRTSRSEDGELSHRLIRKAEGK